MGAQPGGTPLLSGFVPPLASFHQPRPETGPGLADGLRPGETTLLLPSPAGSGGTGKTQLAVGFAHAMWSDRAVDLLAWIPAGSRAALTAGLAQAAADLGLPPGGADGPAAGGPAGSADAAAQRFLDWLSRTGRPWAVILDDVTAAEDVRGLWPRGPAGQVVVTSRLREDELAATLPDAGLTARAVPGFSRREALDYLHARLTAFPDQRIEAVDLTADLGGHPLTLALAAATITATGISCREYRAACARRLVTLAGTLVDGCPPALLAAWSLAVERAQQLEPAGLAWPALVFAAALDTDGIPASVVTSSAACAAIAGGRDQADLAGGGLAGIGLADPGPADADEPGQVRAAYAALERLGLLMVDAASAVRTVWLHPAIRSAVRAYLAPETVEQVTATAAAALLEAWPAAGSPASRLALSQALRDATAALRDFAGGRLWRPDAHPVLIRAGASLAETPALADGGRSYWAELTTARCQRATAYYQAGADDDGALVLRRTLADCERYLGPRHPMTATVRDNLQAATE